ncbi:hypothetical protein HBI56_026420 [Parastagonospora nodorum]|nr:hypothetical protein HBI95_171020 [Parastagonospora nodorum]KAH4204075.1 hypothetical protein HBH42_009520 [Parastagonospora nodorum]KAH4342851.1 hypothetical protein HBH98_156450 [Parastagonospora nodorum]KAH4384709.1 hypothetical protein HBH97_068820 [Parastagonospora nodorum]KAH4400720.1 hypothetical protein HBH99_091690 [Parastagonospora nodorum]
MPSADCKRTRSKSDQTGPLPQTRHSTRNGGRSAVTNIAAKNSEFTIELQIYSHLRDIIMNDVHRQQKRKLDIFTWTPCRSSSTLSPLLCANPKWSGVCSEDERCTYRLGSLAVLRGAWALAASNKMIRNKAQEMFFRDSVVSVRAQDLEVWLDHLAMKNPRHLNRLQRVCLAGPNQW